MNAKLSAKQIKAIESILDSNCEGFTYEIKFGYDNDHKSLYVIKDTYTGNRYGEIIYRTNEDKFDIALDLRRFMIETRELILNLLNKD